MESAPVSIRMPPRLPASRASTTKASQPPIAFLRFLELQRPIRAAMLGLCVEVDCMQTSLPAATRFTYGASRLPRVRRSTPSRLRLEIPEDREDPPVILAGSPQPELAEDARDVLFDRTLRDHQKL